MVDKKIDMVANLFMGCPFAGGDRRRGFNSKGRTGIQHVRRDERGAPPPEISTAASSSSSSSYGP